MKLMNSKKYKELEESFLQSTYARFLACIHIIPFMIMMNPKFILGMSIAMSTYSALSIYLAFALPDYSGMIIPGVVGFISSLLGINLAMYSMKLRKDKEKDG